MVGGRALTERVVLELRLEAGDGAAGTGEAAPLPGLHAERLDELPPLLPRAVRILAAIARETGQPFPRALTLLNDDLHWRALPASLRCGLEGALLRLVAGAADPADQLGLPVGDLPPSSGLVDGDPDHVDTGLACVKVKVGRRDPADEVASLRHLRRQLGLAAEIRLDANRAFRFEDAVTIARAAADLGAAWIEEPLRDPARIPDLVAATGLPVAMDESLHDPEHARLATADGVAAWILKPALLGVHGTLAWFARAAVRPRPPACVVSASFEGPVGLALLETLARCAPGRPAPGLGTARWFGAPEPGPWTVVDD